MCFPASPILASAPRQAQGHSQACGSIPDRGGPRLQRNCDRQAQFQANWGRPKLAAVSVSPSHKLTLRKYPDRVLDWVSEGLATGARRLSGLCIGVGFTCQSLRDITPVLECSSVPESVPHENPQNPTTGIGLLSVSCRFSIQGKFLQPPC